MKTFTNHTAGPRGINVQGGVTRWIEPGQSVEIDPKTIVGDVPDLGKAGDTTSADDTELVESVQAENAALKEQVDTLTKANADLTTKLEAATKKA
jgi:hypothetical protein